MRFKKLRTSYRRRVRGWTLDVNAGWEHQARGRREAGPRASGVVFP
jgi:hypothetical protein